VSGIKSRVLWSFVAIIVLVVALLGSMFIVAVWQYYYGSATEALSQRASISMSFYDKYIGEFRLQDKSRYIMDNAEKDKDTRTEIVDLDGKVVMESYGIRTGRIIDTPDVVGAFGGESAKWIGRDAETGERILALSQPLKEGGRTVGALRYTTSVEVIDQTVGKFIWLTIAIGLGVIALSVFVSLLMANRIVKPIDELTQVARELAKGNFHIRALKRHDDEVGNLADTLNYMSSEMLRNEQLKNDFISSISHELRTPLTSIKGWNETLVSGGLADKDETMGGLVIIAKETDRLIGLVEDLLDFSKLQSGQLSLQPVRTELNVIVEEMGLQFAQASARRQVDFQTSICPERLVVMGDPNRLKQVLINVIDNAIKFSPAGGTVALQLKGSDHEGLITVTDDGPGISPDHLKYVKEKFYKGDHKNAGSGLGLSISTELIQLHGGALDIRSEAGHGTTVSITLPLVQIVQNG